MHMPGVTRLSALCVAGAALTASANASAHYYAGHVASVYGNADDGAFVQLWTNILHSTCTIFTQNFVNHEFWYAFGSGQYWVEVGFKDGETDGGGSWPHCTTQDVFWADNRNGGGYNEHETGWRLATGGWIDFEVQTAGSCTWNVSWDDSVIGTSTNNCPLSGRFLQAGIETTSQTTGSAQGWQGDWWEQDGSGNWHQQWDNAWICQTPDGNYNNCTSGNPQIQWRWSKTGTEEVLNEGW
jgi:hypothetical protein